MKKLDEDIYKLNSFTRVKLAPSKIHGVGIVALRDIKKGDRLYLDISPQVYDVSYANLSKLLPEVRKIILEQWPVVVEGSKFAWPVTRYQAFCNHSPKPNYDLNTDIALEDIKEGEEITEDYRLIPGHEKVWPKIEQWT